MAKKKGRKWSPFWKPRRKKLPPKPQIDHSRPFHEQVDQLQAHIDSQHQEFMKRTKPVHQPSVDEVIISTDQLHKIICAWLYESEPRVKQRFVWLMLLYRTPNLVELAQILHIRKQQLLEALEELKRFN